VTLSGSKSVTVTYAQPVFIRGHAAPGASVGIYFHQAGVPGFTKRRSLIADAHGAFITVFAPAADFLYFAGSGSSVSTSVAVSVTPTLSGPALRTSKHLGRVVLRGRAAPDTVVTLHFHRGGTPANDYSMVRLVRANAAGVWTRAIILTSDYRIYATRGALRPHSSKVLLQIR
jgi:hypothetical protein